MSVDGKMVAVKVSTLAILAITVCLMLIGVLFWTAHQHTMKIWHQKDIDFPYDARYPKLTEPLATISTTNHFMLLAPKGKLILYCSEDGCVGTNLHELQETITTLFADLANRNRAQQQIPVQPGNASTTGPNSPAITGNNNKVTKK